MSGLARIYNPFAYPGIKPGFDSSHPASQGCTISAIAAGTTANFIDLTTGAFQASPSGLVSSIHGVIGPGVNTNGGSSVNCLFANKPNTADVGGTLAGIVYKSNYSSTVISTIITTNQSNDFNGYVLFTQTTQARLHLPTFNDINSGITLTDGAPYFIAVSFISGLQYWVVVNLMNGKTQTATTTQTYTPGGTSAAYQVGAYREGGTLFDGLIAAAMYSRVTFLSQGQLLAWASDPWSFWYPPDPTTLGLGVIGLYSGAPPVVIIDTLGTPIYRVQPQRWGW